MSSVACCVQMIQSISIVYTLKYKTLKIFFLCAFIGADKINPITFLTSLASQKSLIMQHGLKELFVVTFSFFLITSNLT